MGKWNERNWMKVKESKGDRGNPLLWVGSPEKPWSRYPTPIHHRRLLHRHIRQQVWGFVHSEQGREEHEVHPVKGHDWCAWALDTEGYKSLGV